MTQPDPIPSKRASYRPPDIDFEASPSNPLAHPAAEPAETPSATTPSQPAVNSPVESTSTQQASSMRQASARVAARGHSPSKEKPQDPQEKLILKLKAKYLPYILKKMNLTPSPDEEDANQLNEQIADLVDAKLLADNVSVEDDLFSKLVTEIISEVTDYGPLRELLQDDSINEIMVNGPNAVYVERAGKLELTSIKFTNVASLRRLIDHILAPLGRQVDENNPVCDARLQDGSRVNIVILPCAVEGPTITIRKFVKQRFTMEKLLEMKTLSKSMAMFLQAAIRGRLNIVIAGATGTGKTTLLNALSNYIPSHERVITIEDAAELQLQQEHVVRLEGKPANLEGKGGVSIRDLVRASMRMRPDRVIIGECRGPEALDMIQAMNTGHAGSLTTLHANTARDALSRISTLILTAGVDMPEKAIREQIIGSVDLFIQLTRLQDGSRRITQIAEVQGLEGNNIVLQDLFRFEQKEMTTGGKVYGTLKGCGVFPRCAEKLRLHGEVISAELFRMANDVP